MKFSKIPDDVKISKLFLFIKYANIFLIIKFFVECINAGLLANGALISNFSIFPATTIINSVGVPCEIFYFFVAWGAKIQWRPILILQALLLPNELSEHFKQLSADFSARDLFDGFSYMHTLASDFLIFFLFVLLSVATIKAIIIWVKEIINKKQFFLFTGEREKDNFSIYNLIAIISFALLIAQLIVVGQLAKVGHFYFHVTSLMNLPALFVWTFAVVAALMRWKSYLKLLQVLSIFFLSNALVSFNVFGDYSATLAVKFLGILQILLILTIYADFFRRKFVANCESI